MISKETFVAAVNELRRAWDYQEGLNKYFRDNDVDGYVFQPDCSMMLVKVIEESMNLPVDEKLGSDLAYFCYEIDFGRGFKPGCITDNGKDVDFSSAESLYDYLVRNNGEKDEN